MAKTASGGTRADDVQEHLRADILGGRRTPGERLKFPELCEQHEVSASVIREALTRLVAGDSVCARRAAPCLANSQHRC